MHRLTSSWFRTSCHSFSIKPATDLLFQDSILLSRLMVTVEKYLSELCRCVLDKEQMQQKDRMVVQFPLCLFAFSFQKAEMQYSV